MGTYSYTGSAQFVTVNAAGTYDITAYGAAGGAAKGAIGGAGAEIGGNFTLTAGEKLEIVAGGTGGYGSVAGGGGGGSFVLGNTGGGYALLLAAGGGGGGSNNRYGQTRGGAGSSAAGSGAGGNDGGRYGSGGGGSGYKSDGAEYGSAGGGGGANRTGNYAGGAAYGARYAGKGGFGGGGGGSGQPNNARGGGGGGGYTGGTGGRSSSSNSGGGGGSIDKGATAALVATSGENAGAGKVVITPGAVCFAAGTAIRVLRESAEADIAVEELAVGDIAITASGAHRPIRWIGHRTINGRDCAGDDHASDAIWPVRIRREAFAPRRPSADLWLSPSHSICLDVVGEVLIPIYALVNGSTIARVPVDTVTYWHVELDSHDILVANGLPAESYLDMADHRAFFARANGVAAAAGLDVVARTHADFCRPFHDGGALVEAVRGQVIARAGSLGWHRSGEAEIYLEVDGVRVPSFFVAAGEARFTVPACARDVRLFSATTRPVDNGGTDPRRLGIAIYGLARAAGGCGSDEQCVMPVDLDAADLRDGFHDGERDEGRPYRWTKGTVALPPRLWSESAATILTLRYEPDTPRDWIAPARLSLNEVPASEEQASGEEQATVRNISFLHTRYAR